LVLSGFFAMAETSLTRMNKSRARSLREDGRHGAKALVALTEAPEKFLNPLLLLILVCQLVSATMVGVLAGHLFGAAGVFVATAGEVIVIFVVFEAIPKNFAVQHLDEAALATAPVVGRILALLAHPLGLGGVARGRRLGDRISLAAKGQKPRMTESEVLAMADVAHEDDAIESDERNFIHSVIEFGDTIVREVMVPRIDIVAGGRHGDRPRSPGPRDRERPLTSAGRGRWSRRRGGHGEPSPPGEPGRGRSRR
jgi:putative hemolysin